MVTDSLFYRLFETSPETLFLALGMPLDEAQATAAKYRFLAVEFKKAAHRADGVLQPKETGWPAYFLEIQYYRLPSIYANILVKAYSYLEESDPEQEFVAVVLFGSRSLEPTIVRQYQPLLDAGLLRRIYLDELPEVVDPPLGLSILRMIGQPPQPATEAARRLLKRTKVEIFDLPLQQSLLQLIETVIIAKLPRLSRKEIQDMLEVNDLRETRVFQEGREEGREEERDRLLREAVPQLAARGFTAGEIAEILKVDLQTVNKTLGT